MLSQFSKLTGLSAADILGKTRTADVVAARHIYWLLLRRSGFSHQQIAGMCKRNHSSILQGIRSAMDLLQVGDNMVGEIFAATKHLIKTDMSKIKTIIELHVPARQGDMRTSFASAAKCEACHGKGYIYNGGWMEKFKKNTNDPDESPCPCCGGSGRLKVKVNIEWKPAGKEE